MKLTEEQKKEIKEAKEKIKGKRRFFSPKSKQELEMLKNFLMEAHHLKSHIDNSVPTEDQMSVRFDYPGHG